MLAEGNFLLVCMCVCVCVQSTSLITTLSGASEKCPSSRSVVIPEVSLYVLQLDGTLLWAWEFCRYSRIVVISAVVISEIDCMYICLCMYVCVCVHVRVHAYVCVHVPRHHQMTSGAASPSKLVTFQTRSTLP